MPDDHDRSLRAQGIELLEHVKEERPAQRGMQYLGKVRIHPLAETGGENHGREGGGRAHAPPARRVGGLRKRLSISLVLPIRIAAMRNPPARSSRLIGSRVIGSTKAR